MCKKTLKRGDLYAMYKTRSQTEEEKEKRITITAYALNGKLVEKIFPRDHHRRNLQDNFLDVPFGFSVCNA